MQKTRTANKIIGGLKKFKKIIVTGPHRSGSTIAGKIIAKELNYKFLGEPIPYGFLKNDENIVMQIPNYAYKCQEFAKDKGVVIIFMIRDLGDIMKSTKRIYIPLSFSITRKDFYRKNREYDGLFNVLDPLPKIVYDVWNKYQKSRIKNHFELEYESLSKHPMWIKKEKRIHFGIKQTEL